MMSSTEFLDDVNIEKDVSEWSSTGMALFYTIGTLMGSVIIERYKFYIRPILPILFSSQTYVLFFDFRFGRRIMLIGFTSINTGALLFYAVFAALEPVASFFKYGCLGCFLIYGFTYG